MTKDKRNRLPFIFNKVINFESNWGSVLKGRIQINRIQIPRDGIYALTIHLDVSLTEQTNYYINPVSEKIYNEGIRHRLGLVTRINGRLRRDEKLKNYIRRLLFYIGFENYKQVKIGQIKHKINI